MKLIKANGKYYDLSTKNKSFLSIVKRLKACGAKNIYSHLEILDPLLVGVDPHDPNLSKEMKERIMKESIFNHWYYLREVERFEIKDIASFITLKLEMEKKLEKVG